jgi:pimeloyl-ACP methyl ester carboxylesterase
VRRLVFSGTSGGIDLGHSASMTGVRSTAPNIPTRRPWITDTAHHDLTPQLKNIQQPTLLLWGGADSISPPAVGAFLESKLPRARLVVVPESEHMFARDQADQVAPLILNHLSP